MAMSKLCAREAIHIKNCVGRNFRRAVGCYQSRPFNERHLSAKVLANGCIQRHLHTGANGSDRNHDRNTTGPSTYKAAATYFVATGISGAIAYYLYKRQQPVYALATATAISSLPQNHKVVRNDLPTFSMSDVSKHNTLESGVWITYGIGVYDVTKFIPEHPGSDKIMIAAGSSVDPFWHIYQQHNTPEILKLLESFRIGNLRAEDEMGTKDLLDPWSNEPKRSPVLKPASLKPFNAEPPPFLLVDRFLTPNDLFYVRNHLPVPEVDPNEYELEIEVEGTERTRILRLDDIKALPKVDVTATIMCGGNRRSEMTEVKAVKGLSWSSAAVGNAVWSGPRLCDVLREMGIESDDKRHVHLEGLDMDPMSTHYAASIPLFKAMDPRGDVILAYEMNGQPLSRDHGYPIRAICPGIVGARNVKWLGRIVVSDSESDSHWQQNDYKGFSPSTDWDTVDFTKSPAIQNMPVTSAICQPMAGERARVDDNGNLTVKGYAWSGGGSKVVRVDVTADGGKSWHVARLQHAEADAGDESTLAGRNWAWAIWTVEIPVSGAADSVEVWSKAVDSNYNVQPEEFSNIWNLRGVLSNAYSRINVHLVRARTQSDRKAKQ